MNRKWRICAIAATITLWPGTVFADVGTPLVWATAFHLLAGNLLIALFEGWLLSRVFALPRRECVSWLIPANYLSAWVGIFLMTHLFERYATDLYSGPRVTVLLIAVAYLLTLIVEWPFVAACFRGTEHWFKASIKGSLLAQSASYLLLFGGFWPLSETSLYSKTSVVAPEQITPPTGVLMFYISPSDGDVYRSVIGSSTHVKIAKLGSTNHRTDRLELRVSHPDTNCWDIVAVSARNDVTVVAPRISSRELISGDDVSSANRYGGWGTMAFRVGNATKSTWSLHWSHWPDLGMKASNGIRTVRIAFGLPFGGWSPFRVIQLPDDKALLQLDQQLCLVDLAAGKIALLTKGYGVLALHKDQTIEPHAAVSQQLQGP